jgi:hypothetical protein
LKEFKVKIPRRRRNKVLDNSKNDSVEIGVKKKITKAKKVHGSKARQGFLPKRRGKRRRRRRSNE